MRLENAQNEHAKIILRLRGEELLLWILHKIMEKYFFLEIIF